MNLFRLLRICFLTLEILTASFYILVRFTQILHKKTISRKIIFAAICFFSILTITGMVLRSCDVGSWYLPFQTLEYTWVIFLLMLTTLTGLWDMVRLGLHCSRKGRVWKQQHDLTIRRYYYPIIILFSLINIVYGYIHFGHPTVKNITINTNKTVPDWRIVAVSDLHCGTMSERLLEKNVERINSLHPDLILLLGDQSVVRWQDLKKMGYAQQLGKLHATHGVFAINGNHEYIHGYTHNNDPKFRKLFRDMKITLMEDTTIVLNNEIVLVGRSDTSCLQRNSLHTLMKTTPDTLPVLVLDHAPLDIQSAVLEHADLLLCGHTHNGQVFPLNWWGAIKGKLSQRPFYGYKKIDSTALYITAGLGGSGAPIRIGTTGEIVVITLKHTDY